MLTLSPNWRTILRKAWSVRFMGAAELLSGCEAVAPLAQGYIPQGTFAVLSFALTAAALVARIVAQRDV